MADEPSKKLKLALKKTDTSHVEKRATSTGRIKKTDAATDLSPPGAAVPRRGKIGLAVKKSDTSRSEKSATSTGRIKKTAPAPGMGPVSGPTGTPRKKLEMALRKTDTSRIRKTDTGRVKTTGATAPTVPPLDEMSPDDTAIADPTALRETTTSRLRRVQPEIESTAAALAPAGPGQQKVSETVRLKVVREKKKQLADLLTASQTVKIRPSTLEATGAPKSAAEKPIAPSPSDSGLETHVSSTPPGRPPVKPPAARTSASTVKVTLPPTPAVAPVGAPSEAALDSESRDADAAPMEERPGQSAPATLKLRPGRQGKPAQGAAAPPLVPVPPTAPTPPPISASGAETAPTPPAVAPPAEGAGATVKITAPPTAPVSASAQESEETVPVAPKPTKRGSKLTLKVKPGSRTARTVKLPGAGGTAGAAATTAAPAVAPGKAAKTVPVAPPPGAEAPLDGAETAELATAEIAPATDISEAESPEELPEVRPVGVGVTEDDPGPVLTALSVAAAAALGVTAWFTAIQYLKQCL